MSTDYRRFCTSDLQVIFNELNSSKLGLTNSLARSNRCKYGANEVPPPLEYPAWLCCLLPCLLRTESMTKFHEAVPEQATILRDGRWLTMDSHSIIPGDVVKIERGQRVAADIRVFDAEGKCTFDTRMVNSMQPMKNIDTSPSTLIGDSSVDSCDDLEYLQSHNMAFLGYLCVEGSCTGIVVSTGEDTVIGKLIRKGAWLASS